MLKMYAFIQDNKVQNIVPCHSQEDANELIAIQYVGESTAIKIDGYDLTIGDKYENGKFYHFNFELQDWVELKRTYGDEDINQLKKDIENLKRANINAVKQNGHYINYNTCLFEEYLDFRINEAVFKYQEFLENAFILHIVSDEKETIQYQINMSPNNWYGFVNMYTSYKALKDMGIETELYWFDGEANQIIFNTEEECLALMKTWRDQNQRLAFRLNDIIKQIYNCKKKAEIKAIDISFE